ncbi:heterokaryon incompatibility protein-domain-containing protein [Immersiella caudata]|uniref:Heterokaryon incompatibility protein-domain-containing protein n=1 Tax=Immersiella caudata TaxID=314043 RepID=A0AA39WVN1_9PEZI|nr:heterokaryon incompatibility protein-domain-containing protein [Immersiella caudata]
MAFPNRHQLPFHPGIPGTRHPVPALPTIPSVPLPPIATGPCLCLPLHWQCSPDTCTAADTGARDGVEVPEPGSLTSWAIETTIPDLSKAVLRSCRTCTLIYTSLTTAGVNVRWQPTSQIKVSYDGHLVFKPDPAGQQHYELDLLLDPASAGMTPCLAFPTAKPSESTSSHTSFSTLKNWLKTCLSSHPACAPATDPPIPTRLLHIGKPNQNPTLTTPTKPTPYLALSHCWGPGLLPTTTKSTLPQRQTSIPLCKLPKSFRDAIQITRRLGYEYVWIDSLCIIQDDATDWERESAMMAEIYENAILTIAVSDAVDSLRGCFRETDKLAGSKSWETSVVPFDRRIVTSAPRGPGGAQVVPVRRVDMSFVNRIDGMDDKFREEVHARRRGTGEEVKVKRNEGGRTIGVERFEPRVRQGVQPSGSGSSSYKLLVRPTLQHAEFGADSYQSDPPFPLASRGWALQERLLSTRIVHYTAGELVWECKTGTDCQCGRVGRNLLPTSRRDWADARTRLLKMELEASLKGDVRVVMDMWKLLVFQYTARTLTYQSDRLPALSGLAKRFARYEMGRYYAGLWETKFAEQLLWGVVDHPSPSSNRDKAYVAPTWSWASVKERVYSGSTLSDRNKAGLQAPPYDLVGEVVSVEAMPLGLDGTGAVGDGALTIRGMTVNATVEWEMRMSPGADNERLKFWIVDEVSGQSTHFVPDSPADFDILGDKAPVVCVLWNKRPDMSSIPGADEHDVSVSSTFLVLRESKRRPAMYERVGSWSVWESSAGTMEALRPNPAVRVEDLIERAVTQTLSVV